MYLDIKSPKHSKNIELAVLILSLGAYVALFLLTLNRDETLLWKDEEWYLRNVLLLEQYGLSKTFLLKYWGPAGPLYAVLHYILKPITHLSLPGVRIVNIILLGLIFFFIWRILKLQLKQQSPSIALGLFSIPMIYVCSGLALTEMPAMFFATLSILLLTTALIKKRILLKSVYALAGGVALSFSILGRQPYLLVSFATIIYLFQNKKLFDNLSTVCIFIISSLILPIVVFSIWGNLQPPIEEHTGKGINFFHGFLSLGYTAIIILLIAPAWFFSPAKSHPYIVVCILLIFLLNNFFFKFEFLPMKGVLSNSLPEIAVSLLGKAFASLIICLGFYLLISAFINVNKSQFNTNLLFFTFCCLLIIFSSAKITHQFSSRYVAQAAPFIILMIAPTVKFNYFKLIGTILGILMGILSLNSFF